MDKVLISQNWPINGNIEFKEVVMKYREDLEPALKEVSFTINPGMKIGIVGRTGSGKSSILSALLRMLEIDKGEIIIDGVNITNVGLHLLRKSISFIP